MSESIQEQLQATAQSPLPQTLPLQRYSTLIAVFTAMVQPFWTAREFGERVTASQMLSAFVVHLLGIVLFFLVILIWDTASASMLSNMDATVLLGALVRWIDDVSRLGPDELFNISMVGIVFIVWAVCYEMGLFVVALFMMSWVARVEKFTQAYLRTLKRIWLLTPLVVTPAVLIYTVYLVVKLIQSQYRSLDAYYYRVDFWDLCFASSIIWISAATALAFLWALQFGKGQETQRGSTLCEGCGYPLVGLVRSENASCPECGLNVEDSLASRAQLYQELRGLRVIKSPVRLGKALSMYKNDTQSRLIFLGAMLVSVGVFTSGVLGMLLVTDEFRNDFSFLDFLQYVLTGLGFGFSNMSFIALLLIAGTSIVSWLNLSTDRIPAFPAACAAMGYLSIYWPAIVLLQWIMATAGMAFARTELGENLFQNSSYYWIIPVYFIWTFLIVPGIGILIHLACVWLATRQARYANS